MTDEDLQASIAIARDIAAGRYHALQDGMTLRLAGAVVELTERCDRVTKRADLFHRDLVQLVPIQRYPVSSSNLGSIGYHEAVAVLEVEFVSGDVWRYASVPQSVYQALMTAESKGNFFLAQIRDAFTAIKMTPGKRTA